MAQVLPASVEVQFPTGEPGALNPVQEDAVALNLGLLSGPVLSGIGAHLHAKLNNGETYEELRVSPTSNKAIAPGHVQTRPTPESMEPDSQIGAGSAVHIPTGAPSPVDVVSSGDQIRDYFLKLSLGTTESSDNPFHYVYQIRLLDALDPAKLPRSLRRLQRRSDWRVWNASICDHLKTWKIYGFILPPDELPSASETEEDPWLLPIPRPKLGDNPSDDDLRVHTVWEELDGLAQRLLLWGLSQTAFEVINGTTQLSEVKEITASVIYRHIRHFYSCDPWWFGKDQWESACALPSRDYVKGYLEAYYNLVADVNESAYQVDADLMITTFLRKLPLELGYIHEDYMRARIKDRRPMVFGDVRVWVDEALEGYRVLNAGRAPKLKK
ncbi:hypothetical protein D9611_000618 [Ephemerocybe angulata]|uniref:Uncharacterized protein n=1 Tax=Ephemerocybe angulata TaxID=980116 RepID=A0A8H5BN84_9AGAR|nr:hypothetical protein D9611_000618 [Tulosesus angulatus]